MRLLAIDPGPTESAFVLYDTVVKAPVNWLKAENLWLLAQIDSFDTSASDAPAVLAVEMIASYGMAVGQETFDTCVWVGRFIERWGIGLTRLVYRLEVKRHICHDGHAKDANVRAALIDRYGGRAQAIGLKKTPGPLYGMTGDCWAALGVAITAAETSA